MAKKRSPLEERAYVKPELIRILREQRGWTQAELGRRWGKPQTNVSDYELGERHVYTIVDALKLAQIFGVSPSYLLGQDWFDDEGDREMWRKIASLPTEKRQLIFQMADAMAKAA